MPLSHARLTPRTISRELVFTKKRFGRRSLKPLLSRVGHYLVNSLATGTAN